MIINERGDVLEQLPLNSKGKLNTAKMVSAGKKYDEINLYIKIILLE